MDSLYDDGYDDDDDDEAESSLFPVKAAAHSLSQILGWPWLPSSWYVLE